MLNKKGLSPVISYILLISFIIVLSGIVFQWVQTYVPKDNFKCQEGVSVFVSAFDYDCNDPDFEEHELDITLKNNGRFGVAGFFIRASSDAALGLATNDLSEYILAGGERGQGSVLYDLTDKTNLMKPGDPKLITFNLSDLLVSSAFPLPLSFIEIIPIRYEEADNRLRLASCGDAKIKQSLCGQVIACNPACGAGEHCELGVCVPDAMCGDGNLDPGEQCDDGDLDSGDGCAGTGPSECTIEPGWYCNGNPSVCRTVLFEYLASSTNPLSDGWTEFCAGGGCGGSPSSDVFTQNDANSCNTDPSCGSYYIVTRDNRAATKLLSTLGYQGIEITYYRRSFNTEGDERIRSQWRTGGGSWNDIVPSENPTDSWEQKLFNFPSSAENKPDLEIRFWLENSNNGDYAYWDSINVTATAL